MELYDFINAIDYALCLQNTWVVNEALISGY